MRVSQEEKERSRTRIISSAARLVRERGVESTGVADVMVDAGLTHGGFYRHFDSKEALMETALDEAFSQMLGRFEGHGTGGASEPAEFTAQYLSDTHVRNAGKGCPVASNSPDVARAPAPLKAVFSAGVRRTLALLAEGYPGTKRERRAAAARALATMAGAVMIARACEPGIAAEVLAAAREDLTAAPRSPRRVTPRRTRA